MLLVNFDIGRLYNFEKQPDAGDGRLCLVVFCGAVARVHRRSGSGRFGCRHVFEISKVYDWQTWLCSLEW